MRRDDRTPRGDRSRRGHRRGPYRRVVGLCKSGDSTGRADRRRDGTNEVHGLDEEQATDGQRRSASAVQGRGEELVQRSVLDRTDALVRGRRSGAQTMVLTRTPLVSCEL